MQKGLKNAREALHSAVWSYSTVHCHHFVMSVLQPQFHFHKTHPLLQAILWHKSAVASWSCSPGTRSHCRWHTGLGVKRLGSRPHSTSSVFFGHPENLFTTKTSHCIRARSFTPQHWSMLYSSYSKTVFSRWAGHVEERKHVIGDFFFIFRVTKSTKHYLYITRVERLHVLHLLLLPYCPAPQNRQGKTAQ